MNNKIIFLDFDGPLIPRRAYYLPGQTKAVSIFDPIAVSLINRLIGLGDVKIVISSSWAIQGLDTIKKVFSKNGIDPSYIHEDWTTPKKMTSYHINEINWWLEDHPETDAWVSFDDIPLRFETESSFRAQRSRMGAVLGTNLAMDEEELEHLERINRINRTGKAITVSFDNGISWENYLEAAGILDV